MWKWLDGCTAFYDLPQLSVTLHVSRASKIYQSCYTVCSACPTNFKCKHKSMKTLISNKCFKFCIECGISYFACTDHTVSGHIENVHTSPTNQTADCLALIITHYMGLIFQPVSCSNEYTSIFMCQIYETNYSEIKKTAYFCAVVVSFNVMTNRVS